jgi:hypothetical protein
VAIIPVNEQEQAQVGVLCRRVQKTTSQTVEIGFGD